MINTLRIPDKGSSAMKMTQGEKAEDEDSKENNKKAMDTVPNPPSFYYNDIEKWNAKFTKHIKEREYFKKQFEKTGEITCLTRNTNIRAPEGAKSADPKERDSLFAKVLKRRKSRQSNFAPGVIDFDYFGDSAKFQHLISKRSDLG